MLAEVEAERRGVLASSLALVTLEEVTTMVIVRAGMESRSGVRVPVAAQAPPDTALFMNLCLERRCTAVCCGLSWRG